MSRSLESSSTFTQTGFFFIFDDRCDIVLFCFGLLNLLSVEDHFFSNIKKFFLFWHFGSDLWCWCSSYRMKRSEFHETWFFHFKLFYFRSFFCFGKKMAEHRNRRERKISGKKEIHSIASQKSFFFRDRWETFFPLFFAFWSSHHHQSIIFIFHHGPKNFFVSPDLDTRYWYETFYQNFSLGMRSVLFWSSSFWAVEMS